MPGPPAKPPDRRARRNPVSNAPVGLPEPPERPLGPPPKGLRPETRRAWRSFWRTPVAGLVVESDLPALRRLFELVDELAAAAEQVREAPLVSGSMDQPVLNPLATHARALQAEIRQLEDRFGMTPQARLRLVGTLGHAAEAAATLDELAAAAQEAAQPGADPRLAAAGSAPPDPRTGGGPLDGGEPRPRRG